MAQTKVYKIDTEKSKITFSVAHMGFLKVKGHFNEFFGTLVFDSNDGLLSMDSQIKVGSIATNDTTRDESLISEVYLNAEKYPMIRFKSLEVKDSTSITGVLNIKGVAKRIKLPFIYSSSDDDEIFLKITTLLKRKDFNIDFGAMNAMVGDDIKVNLEIYKSN